MVNVLRLYLDYWNNFITISKFAEHYCITEEKAERIIKLGRRIHNRASKYYKLAVEVDKNPL